jgi:hypothetical protein
MLSSSRGTAARTRRGRVGQRSDHLRARRLDRQFPPRRARSLRAEVPENLLGFRAMGSTSTDKRHRIFGMSFATVYPLYVQKVERKGRTKEEVDEVIEWLTGYDARRLKRVIDGKVDFERFFAEAPRMNPNVGLIKGVVCGVRVEDIEDPLMRNIRYLDKLVDELAKGKKMESILRR